MGEIICHHEGRYNLYNSASDGFRFESSLDLNQLKIYIKKEYGNSGMLELPNRLERAHVHGTSIVLGESLDDLLLCNRAGKNEENLTTEECIKRFLS